MLQKDKNKQNIEAYNLNSDHYSAVFDGYGARKDDIDRAIRLNVSGNVSVLELGCGNGRDAEYIVSKVGKANYLGLDASVKMVELAKHRVPDGTFHVKDIQDFDFKSAKYGVIVAFASFLHIPRQNMANSERGIEDVIAGCYTALENGGVLYISSKYGEYQELEIENLGHKKYYYPYTPQIIKEIAGDAFQAVFEIIYDGDYGPSFTLALRKVK